MLNKLKLVFSNNSIVKKILITFIILFVYKIGTYIPNPLIDVESMQIYITNNSFLTILNTFSGGALGQFSVLALGISPYITASIVIQLLQSGIIPKFKEWGEQGEVGKQKLNKATRYLSVFLAFVQALLLILGLGQNPVNIFKTGVDTTTVIPYIFSALMITAGSAFVLWLSDLITRYGIGNGSSIMIVAGIVTSLPSMMTTLWTKYITGSTNGWSYLWFAVIIVLYIAVIVGVVFMESAKRKVPVQYANRQQGGKADSNIPIKLNTSGVIPVIFASTLLSIPLSIVGMTTSDTSSGIGYWFNLFFNYQEPIGMILYVILIYLFSFFYAFMTIDPEKMADNLQKSNAFIPGVRQGEETVGYISKLLFKITLIGATYLTVLALIPLIISKVFAFTQAEASVITIGGTSLLIIVGVAIETTKQMETAATETTYSGLY